METWGKVSIFFKGWHSQQFKFHSETKKTKHLKAHTGLNREVTSDLMKNEFTGMIGTEAQRQGAWKDELTFIFSHLVDRERTEK